jgi:hypothetical protein
MVRRVWVTANHGRKPDRPRRGPLRECCPRVEGGPRASRAPRRKTRRQQARPLAPSKPRLPGRWPDLGQNSRGRYGRWAEVEGSTPMTLIFKVTWRKPENSARLSDWRGANSDLRYLALLPSRETSKRVEEGGRWSLMVTRSLARTANLGRVKSASCRSTYATLTPSRRQSELGIRPKPRKCKARGC